MMDRNIQENLNLNGNGGIMKLSQMEYFLSVAEHLNFTAAARSLYVSQPALSKQIAMLEEELGIKLFYRNSREVLLTDAGEQFKKDLLRIHKEIVAAKERAIQIGKNNEKTIRIGCFDGKICNDFLADVYQRIHAIEPEMQIQLLQGGFAENRRALDRNEIDLLITLGKDIAKEDVPEYRVCDIAKRKGEIVFAKNSELGKKTRLTIKDFETTPLLMVEKGEAPALYENTLKDLERNQIYPTKIIELKNSLTLFTHLQLGSGYAIMADAVGKEHSSLQTYELKNSMETTVIAVWKPDSQKEELLINCFQKKSSGRRRLQ